jgi:hypothetical protein
MVNFLGRPKIERRKLLAIGHRLICEENVNMPFIHRVFGTIIGER